MISYWCFDGMLEVAHEQARGLGEMGMLGLHTVLYVLLTTLALRINEERTR